MPQAWTEGYKCVSEEYRRISLKVTVGGLQNTPGSGLKLQKGDGFYKYPQFVPMVTNIQMAIGL